ncbi:MAG: ATP-dependent DNA helicase [Candidatus Pacebacteria bacterium]|nr:ATP-dependent DNA helicase [Candidatus Paceibacterota bacterium]
MKFEEEYKKLNTKQKEAVDTIEGPVMVIAGPGTGKTQILALRIGNILLKTDTPASGILCLTFTEAGAKEMKRRLRALIGARAEEVRVHTYHGFAGSVIAEFPDHFPHLSRTKQITEIESETLVRTILRDKKFAKLRPAGEPDFYVGKILGAIRDSKKEAWTPEIVGTFATEEIERVKNDQSSLSTRGPTKGQLKGDALKRIEKCERTIIFADAYLAYEEKKRADRKMDFDDLIIELLTTLRTDKLLLQMLQEKFLYILVDEHQDTNDSQNMLIRAIADFFDNPNLFVVGDEKQAIFRFQGASVENFLKFKTAWKGMKEIRLEENYRSHQHILDSSFAMIEQNYEGDEYKNLRIKLKAANGDKPKPVDIVTAGNTEAGDKYLVEEVKEIKPESTVAIIVRRNRDVERVLALLQQNGIPASAERGADIFSHPVGVLYFDLIEYLANPGNVEALARTVAGGLWGLDFTRRTVLVRSIRSGNIAEISKEISAIGKLQKEITKDGAINFLVLAAKLSGFEKVAERNPLSAEVWRTIVALAGDIASGKSIQSPSVLIEELLAYRQSAETKSVKITVGRPDSQVRVMTAHGSKGLEFDYVFLPYATDETWLSRGHGSSFILPREKGDEDEVRDARRLFYVALTRAKKHASIIAPLEDALKKEFTPLRFISELDAKSISQTDLPATFDNSSAKIAGDVDQKQKAEIVEYAKNVLTESGLSVTALNSFLECPSKFLYKSILKVPEAPSVASEKGNAMHEALSYVWHQENKSEEAIVATIESTVKAFFDRSLLPLFEKEGAVEALLADAPKVAKALIPLLNVEGKVLTETWVEASYEGKYGQKEVILKLHGKLDTVVEGQDKTLVYDYKTREAMSVNALKGETKTDSDGNYFRQLIFYKILLEGNTKYKNKAIEPALVFIKPDAKGRCPVISLPISSTDEKRVLGEVQLLIESVWSGKFLTETCGDKDCEWCPLKKETL